MLRTAQIIFNLVKPKLQFCAKSIFSTVKTSNKGLGQYVVIFLEGFLEKFVFKVYEYSIGNLKSYWFIIPVLLLTISINIPAFLTYYILEEIPGELQYKRSPLRESHDFIRFYKVPLETFGYSIIPLITLIYCNGWIIYKLHESRKAIRE